MKKGKIYSNNIIPFSALWWYETESPFYEIGGSGNACRHASAGRMQPQGGAYVQAPQEPQVQLPDFCRKQSENKHFACSIL